MKITISEANAILNEVLSLYPDVDFSCEEKADLIIVAMDAALNSTSKNGPKGYVKGAIINCIRPKLKDHIMNKIGG